MRGFGQATFPASPSFDMTLPTGLQQYQTKSLKIERHRKQASGCLVEILACWYRNDKEAGDLADGDDADARADDTSSGMLAQDAPNILAQVV